MTMKGRSRRRSSPRAAKRRSVWETSQAAATVVAPGTTASFPFTLDAYQSRNMMKGITVVRIVGTIRVNSTDAVLSCDYVMGITVDAFGIVASASDASQPWMWWKRSSALPASGVQIFLEIDIKAKRRFREDNDQLRLNVENNDAAQSLEFMPGMRTLYLLP